MKASIKYVFALYLIMTMVGAHTISQAADIGELLVAGKAAIENGQYQQAVDYLGQILDASGNATKDPQITAFGAAVQAYGLKQFGGPQMAPMVKKYLEDAIKLDPTWEYPKKLLKEVSAK